jgi:hypothetical protein
MRSTTNVVAAALEWYQESLLQRQPTDQQTREIVLAELQASPGKGELKPAVQVVNRSLQDPKYFRPGFRDVLNTARAADGSLLVNDPDFAALLIGMAKQSCLGNRNAAPG